jgi:hypothetical protein
MADLADFDHFYGGDLAVTASGDIAVATKQQRTIQRIIRRLLTSKTTSSSSAYPWQPKYGVGLGERVGEALDIRAIRGDVRAQMRLESSVQQVPAPKVTVTPIQDGAAITVDYTDMSGLPQTFNFDLSR